MFKFKAYHPAKAPIIIQNQFILYSLQIGRRGQIVDLCKLDAYGQTMIAKRSASLIFGRNETATIQPPKQTNSVCGMVLTALARAGEF